MRRGICLVVAAAVSLALAGCGNSEPAAKYRIAVIPKGTSHDFWKSIHAGADQAARERGNTRIVWDGPAKEDQRFEQQQIVERLSSEGVHALILAPCDRLTLVVPVEGAIMRGIPVVIMDSGLELSDRIRMDRNYLGYVATDNRQGGVEAARRMLAIVKDKEHPRVLMLRYQKGSESTEQREEGFRTTIRADQQIQFLEPADEAGATVESAQQAAERLLNDNPNLDGIFAPNESSTVGVLRAREILHRVDQVKQVGFDANEILTEALRAGKLQGLVLQDPFDMGYQSVLRALDFLEGKPAPHEKVKNTNLGVLTRENLDDPAMRLLYARDLSSYLGK